MYFLLNTETGGKWKMLRPLWTLADSDISWTTMKSGDGIDQEATEDITFLSSTSLFFLFAKSLKDNPPQKNQTIHSFLFARCQYLLQTSFPMCQDEGQEINDIISLYLECGCHFPWWEPKVFPLDSIIVFSSRPVFYKASLTFLWYTASESMELLSVIFVLSSQCSWHVAFFS